MALNVVDNQHSVSSKEIDRKLRKKKRDEGELINSDWISGI